MTLGGGVDLAREPRNGRSFEYAGEDPLLSGTVVGNLMKCEQAQHVVGDIKHYVMNDQETGRLPGRISSADRAFFGQHASDRKSCGSLKHPSLQNAHRERRGA
jgi:beta-glucosidase-like glycosyl hydrolase